MKTKLTKTKIAKPVPTPEREPTDRELEIIEHDSDAALMAEPALTDAALSDADATDVASTQLNLARLGLNELAYVRRTTLDDEQVWSIYSAMGHPLGAAPTLEQAWGAIVQNDLRPVHVH